MTIFTIGYEGLSRDDFLALLGGHRIDVVVDIRETPFSRNPGFSKGPLRDTLKPVGLGYLHMRQLGCPKAIRAQYGKDGDWFGYKAKFADYLETQHEAISELSRMTGRSRCALLCYEANPDHCHRSMVADAVKALCAMQIVHIAKNEDRTRQLDFPGMNY